MKRKSLHERGAALLKWHTLAFIIFTIALWWSVLSTFNYPGNMNGPFEVFKPFIESRIFFNLLWGFVLLVHFAIHQSRVFVQQRAYQSHLTAMDDLSERYGTRLNVDSQKSEADGFDEESLLTEERNQRLQSK